MIGVLGRTLLVPGTKPLHQPIQSLLRRLPDIPAAGDILSGLLMHACQAQSPAGAAAQEGSGWRSGLPAALVSCLGSSALVGHLELQATTLLPTLCACIKQTLPAVAGQAPLRLTQEQLEDLLDSSESEGPVLPEPSGVEER